MHRMDRQHRVPLVRLNTDGSRDDINFAEYNDFLPPYGLGLQVLNVVKGANDQIIAVGLSMWRFNANGSFDATFHHPEFSFNRQSCNTGVCLAAANVAFADGGTRLFVGGEFSGVDDVAGPNGERWGAAKFNATDGSLDPKLHHIRLEPVTKSSLTVFCGKLTGSR